MPDCRAEGPGFDPPSRPQPLEDRSGGFGLLLLAKLAANWGVDRGAAGTTVWFELGEFET